MDNKYLIQSLEYIDLINADESGIIKRLIKDAYQDGWIDGIAHRLYTTNEEEIKAFESDWENSWSLMIEKETE